MSETDIEYPTDYRGNTIYDEKKVSELSPEKKPNLQLIQGFESVHHVLDRIGVTYDEESIVAEDDYHTLWIDTRNGEYSEVWAIHKTVPYTHLTAVRLL